MTALVWEEGDACPCSGCAGWVRFKQNRCDCATCRMPPCSQCESAWLECSACGWRDGDVLTGHEMIAVRRRLAREARP